MTSSCNSGQFFTSGNVKKTGMMKIVHEKYKSTKKILHPAICEFRASFQNALEHNKELELLLAKAQVNVLLYPVSPQKTGHCLM